MNKNSQILGILGSGQLARMSAIAASQLGVQVYIYCNELNTSPAEQVATKTFKGSFKDKEAIINFCLQCDVITLENEFIDQEILELIDELKPSALFPNSKTFSLIGDKISEKEHFKKVGLPVAPFKKVSSPKEVISFAEQYTFPVVLKSAKGGYDGFGNLTLKNRFEIEEKFSLLKGELLVEAFIPYELECALMVARNQSGEVVSYPIAHTIQEDHICHFVSVPANISPELTRRIETYATLAMNSLNAVGIFAFEFFITKDQEIYLNESAPRPHNSGHYSIEGCHTSQFENHVRSVLNLPLGKSTLNAPKVLMLNLLGTQNGLSKLEPIDSFLKIENGHLHLYGKALSKKGRKMGHFTILGEDESELFTTLNQLKVSYSL